MLDKITMFPGDGEMASWLSMYPAVSPEDLSWVPSTGGTQPLTTPTSWGLTFTFGICELCIHMHKPTPTNPLTHPQHTYTQ